MRTYQPQPRPNFHFIGRQLEIERLQEGVLQPESHILVVYGRRRIGKTELLEHVFKDRNLLKFEGLENQTQSQQMAFVMRQLAEYVADPLYAQLQVRDWVDVLKYIAERTKQGQWTIYFEEVQWLADYQSDFTSSLKYVWDNFFRHNDQLSIILCGSSPSFMVNEIVKSRALYNRSQHELALKEFSLLEAKMMLDRLSEQEVMDAYLTLGGVPEYLKRLQNNRSVYINLCQESFRSSGFFAFECERIFTSSLAQNKAYREIIRFLSLRKFATRKDIATFLRMKTGGTLTKLLMDLEVCGLIEKYTPYYLEKKSLLARYAITDAYLRFYFNFIQDKVSEIQNGNFDQQPEKALNITEYHQWLAYGFERFCRKNHRLIASILGFAAIKYKSGAYFRRKLSEKEQGYQIDLLFDREDRVITICEIKYKDARISSSVIEEFERKIALFDHPLNRTIQKVLICNHGPDEGLIRRHYFDQIITLSDLFRLETKN